MPEVTPETILRLCGEVAPKPWFPSVYAKAAGLDRDALDDPLALLRLGGLVRIADWEAGSGQGYTLTDTGRVVLENPRALARLRFPDLSAEPDDRDRSSIHGTTWERGETVRDALLVRSPGPVTKALMAAQIAVFAYGLYVAQRQNVPISQYLMTGTDQRGQMALLSWAVWAPPLAHGEWWRLITHCFVHLGAVHLVLNLVGNQIFGTIAERMYGHWRYLVVWVLSGIGGGAAAALFHPDTAAGGSSGALCGLVGAVISGVFLNRVHFDARFMAAVTQYLLKVVVVTVLISLIPGVSWAGHLGGGLVGLVAGALCHFQRYGVTWQRVAALLGLVAIPVLCVSTLHTYGRPQQDEKDFIRRVVPVVNQAAELTETMRKNLLPLVEAPPGKRDGPSLEEAFRNITGLRPELETAKRLIESAGPYASPRVEDARQTGEKYVTVQLQSADQIDRCLRNPDKDVAERHALELINTEYRNARRQWQALFK